MASAVHKAVKPPPDTCPNQARSTWMMDLETQPGNMSYAVPELFEGFMLNGHLVSIPGINILHDSSGVLRVIIECPSGNL